MSDIYVISTGRNAGEHVKSCIESVMSQSIQPREHILIDDISDDDTLAHLEYYKNLKNLQI
ncbi:MAG TPA: hypothetical protein DCM40_33695, partial [Maribacter sp.]|nr:hypothetical protein [Maribacter sp.]